MGLDPLTLGLTAGLGLIGAASSYSQAKSQNDAIKKSQESTREAASANARQIQQATNIEVQKERQRMNRVRAILRVQAAEAGGSLDDGSYGALGRQALIDNEFNTLVARTNEANQLAALGSRMRASLIDLDSRRTNPLLDAFTGSVANAGTGLSMGTSINQLRTA